MKSPKYMIADLFGKAEDQEGLEAADYFRYAATGVNSFTDREIKELDQIREATVKKINLRGKGPVVK